jgi:hypothetical protein
MEVNSRYLRQLKKAMFNTIYKKIHLSLLFYDITLKFSVFRIEIIMLDLMVLKTAYIKKVVKTYYLFLFFKDN